MTVDCKGVLGFAECRNFILGHKKNHLFGKRRTHRPYPSIPCTALTGTRIISFPGLIVIPGAGGAEILGGYLPRRLKLGVRGMIRLGLIFLVLAAFSLPILLAMCDVATMPGINQVYRNKYVHKMSSCRIECTRLPPAVVRSRMNHKLLPQYLFWPSLQELREKYYHFCLAKQ
jgi:hypothetical protein